MFSKVGGFNRPRHYNLRPSDILKEYMADITNVNLLYLRKVRGNTPLSRYAVDNAGSLVVWVPDEMEVRTFHIVRYDTYGRSRITETCNVETLRKLEIAQTGSNCTGVTDDDLYLFKDGRKVRFLPDQRTSYIDIALMENGQRFVCAFSDLLGAGHALAYGDAGGRLLWTKDLGFPAARVAIDRKGEYIVVGGEDGEIRLLDNSRTTLIRYRQEKPVRAVATAGRHRTVFAGGGGVGALDERGLLLWFTVLKGEPVELAITADGKTTAVLLKHNDGTGRLVFLSNDGMPTWDIDYDDARPTGLSLSDEGNCAAVSLRDGSISVYELLYGERLLTADSSQILGEARSAREKGNLHVAIDILRGRLSAVPSDTDACAALVETVQAMRERAFAAAETAEAVGDWKLADTRLGEIVAQNPLDAEVTERWRALRLRWARKACEAGEEALRLGNASSAEAHFLQAVTADPLDIAARTGLADARRTAAENALARGRELLGTGKYTDAIAALTEAQARGASGPEVIHLLRDARIAEAFTLGNELYQDRQYPAALFQFKKVLRLDPDHVEAQRKVRYTQNFLQNSQVNDRFSRLE